MVDCQKSSSSAKCAMHAKHAGEPTSFMLPIELLPDHKLLDPEVVRNIELCPALVNDPSASKAVLPPTTVYDILTTVAPSDSDMTEDKCGRRYCPSERECFANDDSGGRVRSRMGFTYCANIPFLKDTQNIIGMMDESTKRGCSRQSRAQACSNFIRVRDKLRDDSNSANKHHYFTQEGWGWMNTESHILQASVIYNLCSPILSIIMPILMLLVPLIMMPIRGLTFSFKNYRDILMNVLSYNPVGSLLMNFSSATLSQRLMLLLSVGFYALALYQNVHTCLDALESVRFMHSALTDVSTFLNQTIDDIDFFQSSIFSLSAFTYRPFAVRIGEMRRIINDFLCEIRKLAPIPKTSFATDFGNRDLTSYTNCAADLGRLKRAFYRLINKDDVVNDALSAAVDFNTYFISMLAIQTKVVNEQLGAATFRAPGEVDAVVDVPSRADSNDVESDASPDIVDDENMVTSKTGAHTSMCQSYYAFLVNDDVPPIKNDVDLSRPLQTITGPNASGKTTMLKSVIINAILSQQLGVGFFKSAIIVPYDYFHSYMNIPDTSERDSLFQAEAKRCKTIKQCIEKSRADAGNRECGVDTGVLGARHLCILDELFSGTNPKDAVECSVIFLNYLLSAGNVDCMLSTHFADICETLKSDDRVNNCLMEVVVDDDTVCANNDGAFTSMQNIVQTYMLKSGISKVYGGRAILDQLGLTQMV